MPKSMKVKYLIVHEPNDRSKWYWLILYTDERGSFGRPYSIKTIGLDDIE